MAAYTAMDNKAIEATEYFHVSRLLQDCHDHKPDPWLRLVMRRALDIVCKNKIVDGWDLTVEKWFEGATLNKAIKYDMVKRGKRKEEYSLGTLFPLPNGQTTLQIDTAAGRSRVFKIQGKQFPDYVVIIKAVNPTTSASSRLAMVFEGEPHEKDFSKKNKGMFLYQKMFQDAAFCQDINPDMPAIFIALAMLACEEKGPSGTDLEFPEWTQAVLESCVLLTTRLLAYTLNVLPGTDFIGDELAKIRSGDAPGTIYDLYCWVNVEHTGARRRPIFFDARTCFDQFSSEEILDGDEVNADAARAKGAKDHNCEFMRLLQYNNKISVRTGSDDWPLLHDNSEHTFYAKKIRIEHKQIPTTILAVERATKSVGAPTARNATRLNNQIRRLQTRIARLQQKIVEYRAAMVAPPIPSQLILNGLEEFIINDTEEIDRLNIELVRLQGVLAAQVIPSRGMWYPNNVKEILDAGGNMNRPIASLAPLCDFMTYIVINAFVVNFEAIRKKERFEYSDRAEFDKYNGHVYVTLPWLWINIGFLYMLNRKVKYRWTGAGDPMKLMEDFKNKHGHGKWRGGAGCEVEVQMFPKESKTLFAQLCKAMAKPAALVQIDDDFRTFLFETCGWQECNEPESPAMFFRLMGVSNVKTGCLISSAMAKSPNPRFESIKKSFPLNAQVEIDYAVAALAATIHHAAP
jgi:hypothetical protein